MNDEMALIWLFAVLMLLMYHYWWAFVIAAYVIFSIVVFIREYRRYKEYNKE